MGIILLEEGVYTARLSPQRRKNLIIILPLTSSICFSPVDHSPLGFTFLTAIPGYKQQRCCMHHHK